MESAKQWLNKISKHEAWEIAKPWVEKAARTAGIKSLYDVPEYFREKFELKGFKVGDKEFGSGLAGATTALLEESKNVQKKESGGPKRIDLYTKLSELESSGKIDSDEYKTIQAQLDASQPTAVRDAIAKVNKKLALTKEGSVKHSEARKEMARILMEQRRARGTDSKKVKEEVNQVLDNYTNQKVDGIQASREALRTALTVAGAKGLMTAGNLVLDGANFVKNSKQIAQQEGSDFNAKYVADRFAKVAKAQWAELKENFDGDENVFVKTASAATDKLATLAAKFGIDTGDLKEINKTVTAFVAVAPAGFANARSVKKMVGKRLGVEPPSNTSEFVASEPESIPYPPPTKQPDTSATSSTGGTSTNTSTSTQKSISPSPTARATKPGQYAEPENPSQVRRGGVRRAETSDYRKQTTDEQFEETYDERTIAGAYQTRNAQVEYKGNKTLNIGQTGAELEQDPEYQRDVTREAYDAQTRNAQVQYRTAQPDDAGVVAQPKPKKKKKKGGLLSVFKMGTPVERMAFGMSMSAWLLFQLPMATLNLVMFGAAAASRVVQDKINNGYVAVKDAATGVTSWVSKHTFIDEAAAKAGKIINNAGAAVANGVNNVRENVAIVDGAFNAAEHGAGAILGAANAAGSFVVDKVTSFIDKVDPLTFYMISTFLMMAWAGYFLMMWGTMFLLNGRNPLFGEGSGAKFGAVIITLIGYAMPILNYFPWFAIYVFAVWRNPK